MKPIAAILVNYHTASDTVRCVQSLAEQTKVPDYIFIVDNATTAESRQSFEKLKEIHPRLKFFFLFNEKNYGFAAACNQAMRTLDKEGFNGYLWLLNNDTVAKPEALSALFEKAEKTLAGITGSKIILNGKPGGLAQIHPFWGSVKRTENFTDSKYEYIEGSSMLISPECYKKLGPLPECYFLYSEETDYCFKAKEAGFKLAWAEKSIIIHRGGKSTGSERGKGRTPFFIDCLIIRNRYLFSKIHHIHSPGIFLALCLSLLLRIKRKQFSRVFIILKIILSKKEFRTFVERNGGAFI